MFSLTLVWEAITDVRAEDLTEIIYVNLHRPFSLADSGYTTKRYAFDLGLSDFENEVIIS